MAQFRITLAVLWLSWCCCCWSFWSHQLGVECAPDELEDFPLDADADANANANVDSDPDATVDFSTFYQRNSSRSDGQSAEDDVDDLNRVNEDESYETSGAAAAAQDRIVSFNKIMTTAMKEPTIRRSFAQVLPIIRAMSPTQRLTLATLVLKQLTSTTPTSSSSSSSPTLSALSHSNLQQLSNKSAELLLPISADIAAMLQSLKQTATADANAPHSGRSTAFGTYYYNPLPAGYRVNNVQRPVLYSVRRRIQTSAAAAAAERKKTDVLPEMMPPPYVPSANVSYANFENKKPSQTQSQSPDKEDGNGFGHGHDESEEKSEDENSGEESDDYDSDEDGGGDRAANVKHDQERCRLFDDNICYDETYISYPSDRIANSIRNLEHKHVFGALVQDFVQNATAEHSPEIERRLGSPMPSTSTSTSTRGDALQLCASKIKYARPKKAKSTNGNWKFIVNTDHYTQTVRIETCVNADKTCSFLNENVKSHCVQIYNYHRLLTWDEKSGLSLDLFKVPTCCSCQIQQANANAFLPATTKNSKQPQPVAAAADNDLQDNVIVDQSNVIYAPTIMKPKIKNKFNLTPLPLAPYNTLKRDSFVGKVKRPPHPSVLPLQHLDNGGLGLGSSSGIRRTSSKGNILKGVYVPGRGTLPEYTVPPGDVVNANVGAGAGGTLPHHRVNYNYHPIIDFFRSTAAAATAPQVAADRADADTDRDADMAATIDEWLPMTEGPRSARRRRAIATATATAVQL